jgi:hypothetical protein
MRLGGRPSTVCLVGEGGWAGLGYWGECVRACVCACVCSCFRTCCEELSVKSQVWRVKREESSVCAGKRIPEGGKTIQGYSPFRFPPFGIFLLCTSRPIFPLPSISSSLKFSHLTHPAAASNSTSWVFPPSISHTRTVPSHDAVANSRLWGSAASLQKHEGREEGSLGEAGF